MLKGYLRRKKSDIGKRYIGISRSAFLIDEAGKIQGAWYKIKPGETVEKVFEVLEESESGL